MNKDTPMAETSLEEELARLTPGPLDEEFARRLEYCAAGDWTAPTAEELCLEADARGFSPAALDERQMERFSSLFEGIPFAEDSKVTGFPVRKAPPLRKTRPAWWGAAAGVALLGASAALLVPGRAPEQPSATASVSQPSVPAPATEGFTPASFNRDLSDVSSQGIVWSRDKRPHRVMKVGYTERVRLTSPDGRVYEVEQPREQYILVPVSGN